MRTLVIYVTMTHDDDFNWLRDKCVPAVEEVVEENAERLDGTAEVAWDEQEEPDA